MLLPALFAARYQLPTTAGGLLVTVLFLTFWYGTRTGQQIRFNIVKLVFVICLFLLPFILGIAALTKLTGRPLNGRPSYSHPAPPPSHSP
jgi:hypothetical protein